MARAGSNGHSSPVGQGHRAHGDRRESALVGLVRTGSDARLAWAERVIIGVRIAVVASTAALVAAGVPDNVDAHGSIVWPLVAVAALYSLVVALRPGWFIRGQAGSAVLTGLDAVLTLTLIAATGPAASPLVSILFLTIISTGMRFGLAWAVGAALVEGGLFAALVFAVPEPVLPTSARIQAATWWPTYILFSALFTGALAKRVEREQLERLSAETRVEQEHRRLEEAEAAQRQREELLRVVVHEFRTPVASLRSLARHLISAASDEIDAGERQRALKVIQVHAQHLDEMIEALGDVASSRQPELDWRVHFTDVFLPELLEGAIAAAGGNGSVGVTLEVQPASTIARVDPPRVRRIVTNLVENAVRHSAPGAEVEVRADISGSRLRIVVADRGCGLSAEDAEIAFQKYAAFGERRGTSGLGLWIVDELAQGLGGSVEARPRDGGGLAVEVTLPIGRTPHHGF